MRISVHDLQSRMIVDEDVFSKEGSVLISRGYRISSPRALQSLLEKHAVEKIKVIVLDETPLEVQELEHQALPEQVGRLIQEETEVFRRRFSQSVAAVREDFTRLNEGSAEPIDLEALLVQQIGATVPLLNVFQLLQKVRQQDDATFSHACRCSMVGASLATWLKLSPLQVKHTALACLLSDIGKLRVDPAVLLCSSPLTEAQRQALHQHVEHSLRITQELDLPGQVREAIHYHHERMDGSGYPKALTKDQIPLLARVVAVADVYSALIADRPHRARMTPFEALKLMQRDFSDKLDIELLTLFFRKIRDAYIGNPVKLSDGRSGRIVLLDFQAIDRPLLSVDDQSVVNLNTPENRSLSIVEFL